MHSHTLDDWRHDHVFLGAAHDRNERRTWFVVGLTATMMVAEIAGGTLFGSMALLADGWHMSTHAGALAIAAFAYRFARRHARDPRFAFGTGKLGDLAGFASAVLLALIALLIGYESLVRVFQPVPIHYAGGDRHRRGRPCGQSAERLGARRGTRSWSRPRSRRSSSRPRPQSARCVLPRHGRRVDVGAGDRGLLAAWFYGWTWLDPAIGLVGAVVIAHWSWRLIRDAGAVLLDAAPDAELATAIRTRLEHGDDRIADLHVWRVGPGHHAAIVSLVSDSPLPVEDYKMRLAGLARLSHVTVEVHRCNHSH